MKRPSTAACLLTAILLAGSALRFWGLSFGLPHTLARPDESRVVQTAVDFLAGDLRPGFYNYPTLFMYGTAATYSGYCATQILRGEAASLSACAASWSSHWTPFFIIARILSALAGSLTIWLVYRIGVRLFNPTAALAAAWCLACAFLHVRDSHFGVTDVAMTAWVMAAVLAIVWAHDAPSTRRFALAGAVAGLAASTKYNAVLLAAPAAASQLLQCIGSPRPGRFDWRLPAFGGAMLAAFVAGTPYALLDHARFWADATSEAAHLRAGNGIILDIGWRYHFVVSLWQGMTWPVLAAGLLGAVALIATRPRRAALLLAFPIAYYAVAGRGYTVFARYMIPVVPFLCLTAGFAIAAAATRLAPRRSGALAAALALVLAAPSAMKSIELNRILARTDSRVLAAEWIRRNVPAGSSIYLTGSAYGETQLSTDGAPAPYAVWVFDRSRSTFVSPTGLTQDWPQWIVLQESPLLIYSHVPEEVRAGLSHYQRRGGFTAIDMERRRVYDQQDAWFLPLDGFEGVDRPGPNVTIYQRRD